MKLHPQEVSHFTVDLVEENAAGGVGKEWNWTVAWLIKPQRNMCPLNVARPLTSKEVPTFLTET